MIDSRTGKAGAADPEEGNSFVLDIDADGRTLSQEIFKESIDDEIEAVDTKLHEVEIDEKAEPSELFVWRLIKDKCHYKLGWRDSCHDLIWTEEYHLFTDHGGTKKVSYFLPILVNSVSYRLRLNYFKLVCIFAYLKRLA